EFATLNVDELLQDGRTLTQLKEEWEEEDDPRAPLLEIAQRIQKNRNVIRRLLRAQTATEGRRGRRRHADPNSPESRATEVTNQRKDEGHHGRSDADETLPADLRTDQIEKELESQGMAEDAA